MDLDEFQNEVLTDFSAADRKQEMRQAIQGVRRQLGNEYEIVIGGERFRSDEKFNSINPSLSSEIVGVFQKGSEALADKAVASANEAFEKWSRISAPERVKYLLAVSRIMKERRLELASWMVIEVGKSWVEADADVAEAIDFCEFYARQMLQLSAPQPLVRVEFEKNVMSHIPLGVVIVVPPWNFPLAILSGMTFAAIVSGNTVIMKPSSDSPAVAAQLMNIFEEAELPPGVVNLLTGSGSEIGDTLVDNPRTRLVAFTGSKEVGLRINERAAKHRNGQIWIKRVIAEMGGKDAIVVDEGADLAAAAAGVVAAAFGYQGQKCSACSRVIVVKSVYGEFVQELQEETRALIHEGSVEQPEVNFGPVINERAQESIMAYIEIGRREGKLLMGGEKGNSRGYFVKPTIFSDVSPQALIAKEEIFGPVLVVIRADHFDSAIDIANQTDYGLTGSVYTQDRKRVEKAIQEFHVGNLYINRKCTGAMVGVHPFGGFNMSGTDSKAGGQDYLLLFTQAKVISEKVK